MLGVVDRALKILLKYNGAPLEFCLECPARSVALIPTIIINRIAIFSISHRFAPLHQFAHSHTPQVHFWSQNRAYPFSVAAKQEAVAPAT